MTLSTHAGQPCDIDGYDLPDNAPPPPEEPRANDDYFPYSSRPEFELADFLYRKEQMSGKKISELMDIWASYGQIMGIDPENGPPFANAQDLYDTIDSTELGGEPWQVSTVIFMTRSFTLIGVIAWQAFSVQFNGNVCVAGQTEAPRWKTEPYEVWFRDPLKIAEGQIGCKDFVGEMDYAPKRVFTRGGDRQYSDFMSGNWAWRQAVSYMTIDSLRRPLTPQTQDTIAEDPETHGSMFVPLILGSDKTTVSVGTGHNEYYPLYASIGNVHNHVRRALRNAVSVVGFLAIPKSMYFFSDALAGQTDGVFPNS